MSFKSNKTPLMVLGTCSGAGKSLMTAAICRVLFRMGERPLPFKGQNMSNNAWVDKRGGEMGFSQAMQAWAAGLEPECSMNPVLLKPQGNSTSEVIHLGKSVGIANANTYYSEWVGSGWDSIRQGLENLLNKNPESRLVLEGAGSPVEMNLKNRDLTNMRLAKFLNARCLLVADIERGGVFAQIIGTLALLSPIERTLIKGILINRFRGSRELFEEGRLWIENETGIPVVGVMPWLQEIFPPEDSLDLLERKSKKINPQLDIAVIRLPSISNFSDFDPLEAEPTVQLRWISPGQELGLPDAVVIPGSKQTIKDLIVLNQSGLANQIKDFACHGNILGICGGMQMMGNTLEDPYGLEHLENGEGSNLYMGLNILPIQTFFDNKKILIQRDVLAVWPERTHIKGFELHHGETKPSQGDLSLIEPIAEDISLGWKLNNQNGSNIVGTYLHGIFDNGPWRRYWINKLRKQKKLPPLPIEHSNYSQNRDRIIDLLADNFNKYVDISVLIKP